MNDRTQHASACGMAWHGMAWHGMAWHGMAWHRLTWCASQCRRITLINTTRWAGRVRCGCHGGVQCGTAGSAQSGMVAIGVYSTSGRCYIIATALQDGLAVTAHVAASQRYRSCNMHNIDQRVATLGADLFAEGVFRDGLHVVLEAQRRNTRAELGRRGHA